MILARFWFSASMIWDVIKAYSVLSYNKKKSSSLQYNVGKNQPKLQYHDPIW